MNVATHLRRKELPYQLLSLDDRGQFVLLGHDHWPVGLSGQCGLSMSEAHSDRSFWIFCQPSLLTCLSEDQDEPISHVLLDDVCQPDECYLTLSEDFGRRLALHYRQPMYYSSEEYRRALMKGCTGMRDQRLLGHKPLLLAFDWIVSDRPHSEHDEPVVGTLSELITSPRRVWAGGPLPSLCEKYPGITATNLRTFIANTENRAALADCGVTFELDEKALVAWFHDPLLEESDQLKRL